MVKTPPDLHLGGLGSHSLRSTAATRDALIYFLIAVEEVRPEAVRRLRDKILPLLEEKELDRDSERTFELGLSHEDALPLAPIWTRESKEAYIYHGDGPLVDIITAWSKEIHLDKWRSDEDRIRLLNLVGFVLNHWLYTRPDSECSQSSVICEWAPLMTYREFASLALKSRSEGTWSELLRATLSSATAPYELGSLRIVLARVKDLQPPPEDCKLLRTILGPPPPYNPFLISRADWNKQAKEYADRIDKAAKELRLQETIEKNGQEHFVWTALYQVCEESFDDIAESDPEYRETGKRLRIARVQKAVQRIVDLLGLQLRAGRGRPRKN